MTDREIKTLMDSIRNRPGYKGECVKPQVFLLRPRVCDCDIEIHAQSCKLCIGLGPAYVPKCF